MSADGSQRDILKEMEEEEKYAGHPGRIGLLLLFFILGMVAGALLF
jgi:hypothetical protein